MRLLVAAALTALVLPAPFRAAQADGFTQLKARAQQGEVSAQLTLADYYCNYSENEDRKLAARWLRKAADQGNADAQSRLALYYYFGMCGADKDRAEAARWRLRAAQNGDPDAQGKLASYYRHGVGGVRKNAAESLKWARKAAAQGVATSQYALGMRYRNGVDVPQDDRLAFYWISKTASNASAPENIRKSAQSYVGIAYKQGIGIKQDDRDAARWLITATGNDVPGVGEVNDARFHLADLYQRGKGVKQNWGEAIRLLREAAENNHADAQNSLGKAYASGSGVAQDEAEARKWFRRAAAAGHAEASANLKLMEKVAAGKAPAQNDYRDSPAYKTGEAIGSILKFMQWQSGRQDSSAPPRSSTSAATPAEQEQCRAEAQQYIVECAKITDFESCEMTGCDTKIICDSHRGGCADHDAPYGDYGIFYCDTRNWRNRDKEYDAVLAQACPG